MKRSVLRLAKIAKALVDCFKCTDSNLPIAGERRQSRSYLRSSASAILTDIPAQEAECRRNVELMWLLGRLYPDHKSIAEFRRVHREAVTAAGAELVRFAKS